MAYDGPDLAEVAELAGLDQDEVVRRHSDADYTVAFCGFAPGFGYLTGLPAELHLPRRATPRTAVEAGSVGDRGRVRRGLPAPLPRRLAAARPHRRGAVGPRPGPAGAARAGHQSAVRAVLTGLPPSRADVLRAGPLTTVQDLGRPGHAHLGVPRSGAADRPALRRANRMVGNPEDAAGLETTLLGVTVRLDEERWVAVTGADAAVTVDGRAGAVAVPGPGRRAAGDRTGPGEDCAATWRSAAGSRSRPVLGSRSTDRLSGLGPAPLADGDTLPLGPAGDPGEPEDGAGAAGRAGAAAAARARGTTGSPARTRSPPARTPSRPTATGSACAWTGRS